MDCFRRELRLQTGGMAHHSSGRYQYVQGLRLLISAEQVVLTDKTLVIVFHPNSLL